MLESHQSQSKVYSISFVVIHVSQRLMSDVIISMAGDEIMTPED